MTTTTIGVNGRVYERKFDHDEARRLHGEGWGPTRLAERYGVSVKAVRRVVFDHEGAAMYRRVRERWEAICDDCGGRCTHNWSSKQQRHDRVVCHKCASERKREENLLARLDEHGSIHCVRCQQHKPASDYRIDEHGYAASRCRPCETAARRDYRARHREEDRAYMRRRYWEGKR